MKRSIPTEHGKGYYHKKNLSKKAYSGTSKKAGANVGGFDPLSKRSKMSENRTDINAINSQSTWYGEFTKSSLSKVPGVKYTVSVAIPSSVIKNCQSAELRASLVGQIARTCALYEIDEVIVFADTVAEASVLMTSGNADKSPSAFLCRVLQYLETPLYLRKSLFPFHPDLKYAGLLPALEIPHHARKEDQPWFREGVSISAAASAYGETDIGEIDYSRCDNSATTSLTQLVDCGLNAPVRIDKNLPVGLRVTICINNYAKSTQSPGVSSVAGKVLPPRFPREAHGVYWGYQTRFAASLSEVFDFSKSHLCSESDTEVGSKYDCAIGQAPLGQGDALLDDPHFHLPQAFQHLLLVLGGPQGIEACVESDESISGSARSLFTHYIDVLGRRGGSRVIRTEEYLLAALARLSPVIHMAQS